MTRNACLALALGGLFVTGFWGCSDDSETTPPGTGGGGGAAGSTGAVPVTSNVSSSSGMSAGGIGARCTEDGECDMGLRCVLPTSDSPFLGGGAPGGYCTKDCATDGDCGSPHRCLMGECFQGCTFGSPPDGMYIDDPLDMMKCHGREDLRCQSAPDGASAVCIPTCGTDAQCGSRFCDPRSGSCVETPATGKPDGVACNPDAPDEDGCRGRCQPFNANPPYAICASVCVKDGELDGEDCGGLGGGLCIFSGSFMGANAGPGDWGACAGICDSHDDCANPHMFCRATTYSPPGQGYCLFGAPYACPNGQADCDGLPPPQNGNGLACTPTPDGDFCLEVDPTCNPGTGGAGGMGGGGAGGDGGTGGSGGLPENPCLVFPLVGN